MARAKGDKSKKVGKSPVKGPMAKKSSMASGARGRPVIVRGGNRAYQKKSPG